MRPLVYHIAESARWHAGSDVPSGFSHDGFVHCSTWRQLVGVARALFRDRKDIVVLELDVRTRARDVRYEDLYDAGEEFPHLYGVIDRTMVRRELRIRWVAPGQPIVVAPQAVDQGNATLRAATPDDDAMLALLGSLLSEDGGPDSQGDETNGAETTTLAAPHASARANSGARPAPRADELADDCDAWLLEAPGTAMPLGYALVDATRRPHLIRHIYVDRGLRRAGLGRRIVSELERVYATERFDVDVPSGSDAALRFWSTLGFGERVRSLRRESVAETVEGPGTEVPQATLAVVTERVEEASAFILENLRSFNDSRSPYHRAAREPGAVRPVAVLLLDSTGRRVGGVSGSVHWEWIEVEYLWVSEAYRGRGYGSALLRESERLAVERGARRAQLTTFHFQARGFYEKHGYRVVGEMADLPPGGAMFWMRKDDLAQPTP